MKVLILGATGHIGKQLVSLLNANKIETIAASRKKVTNSETNSVCLDTTDSTQLAQYLKQVEVVVNCVAGDGRSIKHGAKLLTEAALKYGRPKIIHLSTMSVYGHAEGVITEDTPVDPKYGWYAEAKCEAEMHMKNYAVNGGQVIMFRPACVYGPGSVLWVSRLANLLRSQRLGDLGESGDGWSNLVHVDDVARAIKIAIETPMVEGEINTYNLAAPDSPRWNKYLYDLAESINATPIKRISNLQLKLDSKLLSPIIKVSQIGLKRIHMTPDFLPEIMPPGIVRLFNQQIFLDSTKFSLEHQFEYTPYEIATQLSAKWLDT